MSTRLFAAALLLLLLRIPTLRAQEPSEVDAYLYECIQAIDAGEHEKAWEMLEVGAERYPDRSVFRYEQAYIRYAQERYDDARKILEKILTTPDANDRYYMLLGNAYDMSGDPKKAIKTYEKGLEIYPESGHLYLELGGMAFQKEEYDQAVEYWETGLTVQPDYSSNFFHAGRMFLGSSMRGWGLLYGEIFHALEPSTERTVMMREMLWHGYDDAVRFDDEVGEEGDDDDDDVTDAPDDEHGEVVSEEEIGGVSLFNQINVAMSPEGELLMPLEMYLEMSTAIPAVDMLMSGPPLTIATLHDFRSKLIDMWYANKAGAAEHFDITLFDYQRRMKEAGVFEAYDHVLFYCEATSAEVDAYIAAHPDALDELGAWFQENPYPATVNPLSRLTVVGMPIKGDLKEALEERIEEESEEE